MDIETVNKLTKDVQSYRKWNQSVHFEAVYKFPDVVEKPDLENSRFCTPNFCIFEPSSNHANMAEQPRRNREPHRVSFSEEVATQIPEPEAEPEQKPEENPTNE